MSTHTLLYGPVRITEPRTDLPAGHPGYGIDVDALTRLIMETTELGSAAHDCDCQFCDYAERNPRVQKAIVHRDRGDRWAVCRPEGYLVHLEASTVAGQIEDGELEVTICAVCFPVGGGR